MHTPTSSTASSPTIPQSSNTPTISHSNSNIPIHSANNTSFPRDTTPISTNRVDSKQASTPSTPSSVSSYSSASSTPCASGIQVTFSGSQPSAPLAVHGTATDARRAVGGSEVPIDLRGLSTLPSATGVSDSAAVLGGGRIVNLPTLKNPQGELLDLNELAGASGGLTPTQETFSLHSPLVSTVSYDGPQSPPLTKSLPMAGNVSPVFSTTPFYQSALPTMTSFSSLPSMASVQSSLSSLASTPSLASQPSPSIGSDSGSVSSGLKTPNVYINGLPPNFPEESLLEMTKPFGEVISVRTFTRHVSDKPSGYGFVLFGSIDAAENCIEALRKYRNLHPSFSKQIHKIPGTSYSLAHADSIAHLPLRSDEAPDTFKAKMERLKDTTSTNLYMEGLPLSIDEETLQVLVSPYRIMSSRFFRTRLSNPPRIIAFVRLESREAAEDIVERLHGRMVRGYCDAGSRISVRFADTSEQRELRRVERMNPDGETSPARLTMAQAALLNLKGTQLSKSSGPRLPSPNFGVVTLPPVVSSTPPTAESAFVVTPVGVRPLPPPIGLHHQTQTGPANLRNSSVAYDGSALELGPLHANLTGNGFGLGVDSDMLQMQLAGMDIGPKPHAATRAQNGFTAMERLILQSHEQRQRQEALAIAGTGPYVHSGTGEGGGQAQHRKGQRISCFNPTASEFSPSMATIGRLKAPTTTVMPDAVSEKRRLVECLPTMSENDFHARAQQQPKTEARPLTLDQESRAQFTRQRNQTHAEAKAQAEAEARVAHARSTTVPSHYLNTDISRGLYAAATTSTVGHSPQARRNGDDTRDTNYCSQSQPKATSINVKNIGRRFGAGVRTSSSIIPISNSHKGAPRSKIDTGVQQLHDTHINTRPAVITSRTSASHGLDEDEEEGSGLDSPALSYSTRSPASLSPATPFSAFGETFDGPPMAKGDVGLGVAVDMSDAQAVCETKGASTGVGVTLAVGARTKN